MKRKPLALIFVAILIINILATNTIIYAADYDSVKAYSIYRSLKYDKLSSASMAVVEYDNGQLLLENNSGEKRSVGDLVKLMSLYIVFDNIKLGEMSLSDTIMGTPNSVNPKGNKAFIYAGEKFSLESGLKAIIINNCNDVMIAIAENIAGSEEKFVEIMNNKAKELNLNDTTFVDCTGLSSENKSTAKDIAFLARALVKNHPDYLDYSQIWMDTFRNGTFNLYNTNRLIKFMPDSDGLKYGYSAEAGDCLVATVKEDTRRVISVVLGAEDENNMVAESRFLLEYALKNYTLTEIVDDGMLVKPVKVKKGVEKEVNSIISGSKKVLININDKDNIEKTVDVYEEVEAPVKKGDKLGTITYTLNDIELAVVDVVAEKDVKKANWFQRLIQWILEWFGLD